LLSHDLESNPVYEEACTIGRDFARLSQKLVNLKKTNRVAMLVSNEAFTAMEWFPLPGQKLNYNDVVRLMYDELYKMNIGCDMINPSCESFDSYDLIIVPALYAAADSLLERLNSFVFGGGHVVYTFKSGFADEHIKVRTTAQPGIINEACGISYSQFVEAKSVSLKGDPFGVGEENNKIHTWMELLVPTTAHVLAYYDHPHWGTYAAVTSNSFGKGTATYIGCLLSAGLMGKILERVIKNAELWGEDQKLRFPLIVKSGINELDKTVRYYFNYSDETVAFTYPHTEGTELLSERKIKQDQLVELERWGVVIVEEL
jgi:beta-galactosidase